MKTIQNLNAVSKIVFALIFFTFISCSDDKNVAPEGAQFVDLPNSLLTDYNGSVNYNNTIIEVDATATISKTGNKVYKVSFSDEVPEITGLHFIENDGTFASASGSDSAEGVGLRTGNLSVGVTNDGKQWQFSSN